VIAIAINTAGLELGQRRFVIAAESRWQLAQQTSVRFHEVAVQRTARSVYGYPHPNPFLRDLLAGVHMAIPAATWFGYVHADIIFMPEFPAWVDECWRRQHGVLTACRLNVGQADSLRQVRATRVEDAGAPQGAGVELLLVHANVYAQFTHQLPDIVVGIDAWGRTAQAAARGLKPYYCASSCATPLRHIAHPHHPGAQDSLVRRLNHLMLRAATRA
jgi:hypothetical protein